MAGMRLDVWVVVLPLAMLLPACRPVGGPALLAVSAVPTVSVVEGQDSKAPLVALDGGLGESLRWARGRIGGACRTASECRLHGSRCLTDVPGPRNQAGIAQRHVPGGMCSLPCGGTCPQGAGNGNASPFCVDSRSLTHLTAVEELDDAGGLCVARCDPMRFPRRDGQPTDDVGCAPGYRCLERNRFGHPGSTAQVCIPGQAAEPACAAAAEGDLLVELDYPDRGALYIPAEARCGGELDLVVALHGINTVNNATPSLGGGRRLELDVRAQIDAGLIRPLLIAEPVHFQATSDLLYGADFSPAQHLDLVHAELASRGIGIASLSYTGHSGAGCHTGNGLSQVLHELPSLIPAYAPSLKLIGLQDVCYGGPYHHQDLRDALSGRATAVVNFFSVNGDPSEFEEGLLPDGVAMGCQSSLYSSCIASLVRPWCSYRTRRSAGVSHDSNPALFVREVFPKVFSPSETDGPCHAL